MEQQCSPGVADPTPTPPKSSASSPSKSKDGEPTVPIPQEETAEDEDFPEDLEEDLDPGLRADRGWRQRRRDSDSDTCTKALEDLRLWDSTELLGWLLLRRAGLTTQSRLAAQAAAGNSLRFEDIERCLRNMEEELTTHDDQRRGHGQRSSRTLWVEEDGHWSRCLMAEPDVDEMMESQELLYVGTQLPHDVYTAQAVPDPAATAWNESESGFWNNEEDGSCIWWQDYGDGDFYHEDASGIFWSWNHAKKEEAVELTAEQQREIQEAYSAAEAKVRTFTQARQAVKVQSLSRVFILLPRISRARKGKARASARARARARVLVRASDPRFQCFIKLRPMPQALGIQALLGVLSAARKTTPSVRSSRKGKRKRQCPVQWHGFHG